MSDSAREVHQEDRTKMEHPRRLLGLLSERELCVQLAVSRWTLLRWRRRLRRPLPHLKIGGAIFYRLSAVESWLLSHEVVG